MNGFNQGNKNLNGGIGRRAETPHHTITSVIVSNEGVFYKFKMQIKNNRLWTTVEVINQ
jgi:hypothetical protein